MPIKLYYMHFGPPSRAVNLAVNALGLNVEYIIMNAFEKDQPKPEFQKGSVVRQNQIFISEEAKQVIYNTSEMYLEGKDWIAGDTMTIADFYYISSIASIKLFVPIGNGYSNLKAWMERCATTMTNYKTACADGLI